MKKVTSTPLPGPDPFYEKWMEACERDPEALHGLSPSQEASLAGLEKWSDDAFSNQYADADRFTEGSDKLLRAIERRSVMMAAAFQRMVDVFWLGGTTPEMRRQWTARDARRQWNRNNRRKHYPLGLKSYPSPLDELGTFPEKP